MDGGGGLEEECFKSVPHIDRPWGVLQGKVVDSIDTSTLMRLSKEKQKSQEDMSRLKEMVSRGLGIRVFWFRAEE